MEAPQPLYNQTATHFALRLFIRRDTEVEGQLIVELASSFLSDLLFPGCRITSFDTKRPGEGAKLNTGEFSERRWNAAVKKTLAGEYAVVAVQAQTADFPNQKIWMTVHVNPPGGKEFLPAGTVEIMCSVSYLRHLAASAEKVEALLRFGKTAWDGIDGGGPCYGYGHIAISPPRPMFHQWTAMPAGSPLPWDSIKAPEERVHAIPVAYVGDIENYLQQLYCKDRGIKGAFWANFLSATHVRMAGGEQQIRAKLPGMQIETLKHGGLLVVATDSPLPEDNEENRQRFLRLHAVLQPAFLSRAETEKHRWGFLGYFYREQPPPA